MAVNLAWADVDSGTSRELDAYCVHAQVSEQHEFFECSAHLLVECINNPQPIAFFAGNAPTAYPVMATRPAWLETGPLQESLGVENFHHHFKGKSATNYCTFVAKKSGEWMVTHADEQHQEFTTLAVLTELVKDKQRRVLEDFSRPQDAIQICGVSYINPVLVVEGEIFEVSENAAREITLRSVSRLRYLKSHIWKGARRYCPIDIVTEPALPVYLRQVEIECKRTLARLERRAEEIEEAAKNDHKDWPISSDEDDVLP